MASRLSSPSSGFSRITVQRTLEHLRRGTVVINDNVATISMNTHIEGNENLGARQFLFENIPQLKYRSPHIEFKLQKQDSPNPLLTVKYKDGSEKQINCTHQSSSSILEALKNICSWPDKNATPDEH